MADMITIGLVLTLMSWRLIVAELAVIRLRKQLPEGMQHCTILFKECEKGHGWLTANNWVQHGCQRVRCRR